MTKATGERIGEVEDRMGDLLLEFKASGIPRADVITALQGILDTLEEEARDDEEV